MSDTLTCFFFLEKHINAKTYLFRNTLYISCQYSRVPPPNRSNLGGSIRQTNKSPEAKRTRSPSCSRQLLGNAFSEDNGRGNNPEIKGVCFPWLPPTHRRKEAAGKQNGDIVGTWAPSLFFYRIYLGQTKRQASSRSFQEWLSFAKPPQNVWADMPESNAPQTETRSNTQAFGH